MALASSLVRPKRRTPSSVTALDYELQKLITDLRIEQGWTHQQICDKLVEFNAHISKSAMQRHCVGIDQIAADLVQARQWAKMLGKQIEASDQASIADINIELMQVKLFKLMQMAKDGVPVDFSPKEMMEAARALSSLISASKNQMDVIEKAEKRGEEKAKKAALAAVDKVAKRVNAGLTKQTVADIKREILGVG
jgi:hypothetical protein